MRLPTTLIKKLFLQLNHMRHRNLPLFIIILITCLATTLPEKANAQVRRGGSVYRFRNIPEHDERPYHFGFSLGVNTLNFHLTPVTELPNQGFAPIGNGTINPGKTDSLRYVLPHQDIGFHIGIVSNLKLGRFFDLRFVPAISFGDRYVEYYEGPFSEGYQDRQSLDATILEFPVHIKYKSVRMTNTRAYVIGGIKYTHDLSSTEDVMADEIFARLAQNDLHYEFGVGFDHYFYYFKFSTEIKASFGLTNLIREGNQGSVYYDSIHRLNSRSIMVSFLFE